MSIKGLDSLISKLNSLGGNSHKAIKKGVTQATKLVQGDAKLLAPVGEVDGGNLRDSIRDVVEDKGDVITGKTSTNVYYAPYVEFGTGLRGESSASPPKADIELYYRQDWAGMAAQPFLYPAIAQNKDVIKDIIADSVKDEIKRLKGGG